MSLIWGALRAVSVEALGVLLVVWMLYGTAWTVQRPRAAVDAAKAWFQSPPAAETTTTVEALDQQEYTRRRLRHYGRLYQQRAHELATQLEQQVVVDPLDADFARRAGW